MHCLGVFICFACCGHGDGRMVVFALILVGELSLGDWLHRRCF